MAVVLDLGIGSVLTDCPMWWQAFMYTHRLRSDQEIEPVLKRYGGVFRDNREIVFEDDYDSSAFILKYNFYVDPDVIDDY